jgi:hypothetical protein
MSSMSPAIDERQRRARRNAVLLAIVAVGFYVLYYLVQFARH